MASLSQYLRRGGLQVVPRTRPQLPAAGLVPHSRPCNAGVRAPPPAATGAATAARLAPTTHQQRWCSFDSKASRHRHVHPGGQAGLAVPIVPATTFVLEDAAHGARLASKPELPAADEDGYFYQRWGNPTADAAATVVADLEGALVGTKLFASGMAAITSAMFSVLSVGDHVVLPASVYGGTNEFMELFGQSKLGLTVTYVDGTSTDAYRGAIRDNTSLMYVETPCNPTLGLTDLEAVAALGKEAGIPVMVDSTFASPYHQTPLEHDGVVASIHSATKWLGGHSDVIGGCVSTNDHTFFQQLGKVQKLWGATLGPFESYLLVRSMKTLPVRMERHSSNALTVAQFLDTHPKVEVVNYPGLESHPSHELAKRTLRRGFGGVLSFEVKGGAEAGIRVLNSLQVVNLAVSLGGVESLVEQPSTMTHTMVDRELREAHGITDGLIRFSVGLEGVDDIIQDLDQALAHA